MPVTYPVEKIIDEEGNVLALVDVSARALLGDDILTTNAQTCTGAINELKGTLTDISKTVTSSVSFTPKSGIGVSIDANRTVFKERNGIILARLGLSISTPSNFNTNTEYNMGTFSNFTDYNLGGYALGIVVRNADSKQIGNYMLTSGTLYVNFTIAPPTTIYMEFTFIKTS